MIVAISRFRVKNGMEEEVQRAFLDRPRLVDSVPGFLGLETFRDIRDDATFYLITRWTDVESFRRWHHSEEHHSSHRFLPKGLKLDASMTKLVEARRLEQPTGLDESVADAAPFLATFLQTCETVHYIAGSPDGVIRVCSGAVLSSLRMAKAQLEGASLYSLLTESDAEMLKQRIAGDKRTPGENFLLNFVSAGFHPFTLQCHIDVHPDGFVLVGERRTLQETALQQELLDLNNELAVMSRENARKTRALERASADLQQELSSRKKLMLELEQSNEDLQQFAHIASHDLMEPLRTVAGFSQLLQRRYRGNLDREADEFLDFIVNGARRLYRLIDDLLAYSRAGRPGQQMEWLDLNRLVPEICKLLSRSIDDSGGYVQLDSLPVVFGYRTPIFQLFENLISNAVRFRSSRPPIIQVSARTTDRFHHFTVADNGMGISPEYLHTIFEPFRRLDNGPTSGSGIGLALCRKIVERHGGVIWAESENGVGSKFHFTFDRALEGIKTDSPVHESKQTGS